ncbi:MAG: DUF2510 domain-containing protein [Nocardioidaceae bacterium]
MSSQQPPSAGAGWYPDPWHAGQQRWFDGTEWTAAVQAGRGPFDVGGSKYGGGGPRDRRAVWVAVSVVVALVLIGGVAFAIFYFLNRDAGNPAATTAHSRGVNHTVVVAPPTVSVTVTSSATPPATSPSTFSAAPVPLAAGAINSLLDASGQARQTLRSGLAAVQDCSDVPDGIVTLQQVVSDREQQLAQAESVDPVALPNGTAVRQRLIRALHVSLLVDESYLTWAYAADGCYPKPPPLPAALTAYNEEATASKQAFLFVWNPVAAEYGFTSRQETDF